MYDLNYFLPGQLWQYDTRPDEENSLLTVLKIDDEEDYTIIHVRLDNINFGSNGYIEHLAFSADAMMNSVTGFIKHLDKLPDFKEGYDHWKQRFKEGKANYWEITVKEAVEAIGQMINKKDISDKTGEA